MKVVVQRAGTSSVTVNEKCVGKIDSGLVLLVAFKETDTIDTINYMIAFDYIPPIDKLLKSDLVV